MRMLLTLAAVVGFAASLGAQTPPTPATINTDLTALQTAAASTATAQAAKATTAAALLAAQTADTAAAATLTGAQGTQATALAQLIADLNAVYGTPVNSRKVSAWTGTTARTITAAEYAALTGQGTCANGSCSAPPARQGIFGRRR